jgi:ABC-type sugar transport system ATPase subunit
MNLVQCRMTRDGAAVRLEADGLTVRVDALAPQVPTELVLGVRPPDVELVPASQADVVGRLEVVERLGHETLLHVAPASTSQPLRVLAPGEPDAPEGSDVGLRFRRERLHLFELETGRRID